VLGVHYSVISRALARVKRRAASRGFAPEAGWTHPVPDPHYATGVSTLHRRGEPEPLLVWTKSAQASDERRAILWREWCDEFAEPLRGTQRLPKQTRFGLEELCNEFLIGDPHVGMFAWAEETLGEDWDLKIAEQTHVAVMAKLVADAPAADTAHIVYLGDTTHADNYEATTRKGGNRLDVDSRFPKMIRTALRMVRIQIDQAAQTHRKVRVTFVKGNHDELVAVHLAEAFAMLFEGDRIQVDTSPSTEAFFRWGVTLSMYTHGHRMKDLRMVGKMSRHPDWSATRYHEIKHGHVHHSSRREVGNATVESFEVLPPSDAWHAAEGYAAGRSMTRITYHLQHGEIGRGRCPVSMVQ
jgi:hypothetical protein